MQSALAMPDYEWIASPAIDNVGMLQARDNNRPLSSVDRWILPVLHNPGYLNASIGGAPETDPAPTSALGDPIWVQPPAYFGRQGTPIKMPRSLGLRCDVFFWQDFLAEDATDLDDAGVMRFFSSLAGSYDGFLLNGVPWLSRDLVGPNPSDFLPIIEDPAKYAGGEYLQIVNLGAGANYGNTAWSPVVLLPSDVSQLATAKAAFKRLAIRMWGFVGITPASIAFFQSIAADCVAAGIDCTFNSAEPTQADIRADYEAFFGI